MLGRGARGGKGMEGKTGKGGVRGAFPQIKIYDYTIGNSETVTDLRNVEPLFSSVHCLCTVR